METYMVFTGTYLFEEFSEIILLIFLVINQKTKNAKILKMLKDFAHYKKEQNNHEK